MHKNINSENSKKENLKRVKQEAINDLILDEFLEMVMTIVYAGILLFAFNGPNSAPLTSNFQQGLPEPPSAPHRFISNSSVTSNGSQSLSIPWNQAFDSTNFDSDNSSVLNSTASLDHTMQEDETSRHHY